MAEKQIVKGKRREYKLKKELGLWETTLCGVGIILGAGIYALVGKAAGLAGNMVWLSLLIAAFAASTTGLAYAELSSIFPGENSLAPVICSSSDLENALHLRLNPVVLTLARLLVIISYSRIRALMLELT